MPRVSRHVNTYGYSANSATHTVTYIPPSGTPVTNTKTVRKDVSVRNVPVTGTRVGSFRKPTNWSMLAERTEYNSFSYKAAAFGGEYRFFGNGAFAQDGVPFAYKVQRIGTDISPSIDPNLIARVRVEALNKIKDQKVSVGVALAESKATVDQLAVAVSRLLSLIRAFRSGWKKEFARLAKLKKPVKWKDLPANEWLSYWYGWVPLFSDIYGLQEQIKAGFRDKDQVFSVSRQLSQPIDLRKFIGDPNVGYSKNTTVTGQASEFVAVNYWQQVSKPRLLALNQLGVTNPLLIAWELVPFSFVLDWVLPIGAFLDGLTATLGTDFKAGYEDRGVFADVAWATTRYAFISGEKCKVSYKLYAFKRITKSTWDHPVPYWKNPFTTNHVVTAIALLHQQRK